MNPMRTVHPEGAQVLTQRAPRSKLSLREPFAAWSHLFGAFAGIFGCIYLMQCSNGSCRSLSAILIYSFALILLFLVSGLFHGVHGSDATISKFERLDYAAIYLLIAGTYTPVCLFVITGTLGIGLLIGEWALALCGMWLALTRGPSGRNLQVCIYLLMGWAFLLALPSLASALTPLAFNLLILGGILYSVGAVIFAFDWPSLFRTRFSAHDCWHLLVLLASAAHYALVVQIVS